MEEKKQLFCDYLDEWVKQYKEGTVRAVTLNKWHTTSANLRKIAPNLTLEQLDRSTVQKVINEYAETHEKGTTKDFFTMIKAPIMDAFDEGIITKNPTRKITIKGKKPRKKGKKYLSMSEVEALISVLDLDSTKNGWDWMILLALKTGFRLEELLGLTVENFDFEKLTITVEKSLDYKYTNEFAPTKNASSMRTIKMDWKTAMQFANLLKDKEAEQRVFDFVPKFYSTTINDHLRKRCREAHIPEVTMHCLRHTHASILMYKDISTQSIAKRLGHSSPEVTQRVYLHLIKELEAKDEKRMMAALMEMDY